MHAWLFERGWVRCDLTGLLLERVGPFPALCRWAVEWLVALEMRS